MGRFGALSVDLGVGEVERFLLGGVVRGGRCTGLLLVAGVLALGCAGDLAAPEHAVKARRMHKATIRMTQPIGEFNPRIGEFNPRSSRSSSGSRRIFYRYSERMRGMS